MFLKVEHYEIAQMPHSECVNEFQYLKRVITKKQSSFVGDFISRLAK
jgi:hypothetical protein